MTTRARTPLLAAGIFGLTGVALGAMGAHALAVTLAERGMSHAWETAAHYHVLHAIALLGASAWLGTSVGAVSGRLVWAARCWGLGIILFSGSLYGLALGAPRWFGPITPLGGIALMAGWLFVIAAAMAKEE